MVFWWKVEFEKVSKACQVCKSDEEASQTLQIYEEASPMIFPSYQWRLISHATPFHNLRSRVLNYTTGYLDR